MKPINSGFPLNLFLAVLLLQGCAKTTALHVKCLVLDQNRMPISGATISLDSLTLASSNMDGQIDLRLKVDREDSLYFQIAKESDQYYFDTSTLTINTPKAQRYEKTVEVVLRAVPKIFAATASPVDPEVAAPKTDQSRILVPVVPAPLASLHSPVPGTRDVMTAQVELQDSQRPEGPPLPEEMILPLNIHVRAPSKGAAGATVYISEPTSQTYQKACETNDRGRCLLNMSMKQRAAASILVRQTGFLTKSVTLPKTDAQLVFVDLEAGASVDIFALRRSWSGLQGLMNLEVRIDSQVIGRTDVGGFFSIPVGKINSDGLLTVTANSFMPPKLEVPIKYGSAKTIIKEFVESSPKIDVLFDPLVVAPPVLTTTDLRTPTARVEKGIQDAVTGILAKRSHLRRSQQGAMEDVSAVRFQFKVRVMNEQKWEMQIIASCRQLQKTAIRTFELPDIGDTLSVTSSLQQALEEIITAIRPATAVAAASEGRITLRAGLSGSAFKVGDRFHVLSFDPMHSIGILQDRVVGEVHIKSINTDDSLNFSFDQSGGIAPKENDLLIYKQGEQLSWQPKHKLKNL